MAFSQATNVVIANSEDAYRAANELRQKEQVAAAVYAYDKDPHWNPYTDMKPLLTSTQLQARIEVLDGLKTYAASLVQLAGKPSQSDTNALNSAAAGVGSSLRSLSQTVSTELNTAVPGVSALTATEANVISTAVLALGEYLQGRRVRGTLPKVTQEMDKNVQTLCNLLKADVTVLRRQADVDYTNLVETQNQFIQKQGTALNPIQRRNEIEKLISIAGQQKANEDLLQKLQAAIGQLAVAHQALAAAAQGNHPEALNERIAELVAAGQELGNFYQSIATK